MTAHNHHSKSNEHYTPSWIVQGARYTLGDIDLDPASCIEANKVVGAERIYTEHDNGLKQTPWKGRIFLNPPGGLIDSEGRKVIKAKDGIPNCTQTGACGLPPWHKHSGVTSSATTWWSELIKSWRCEANQVNAVFVGFSLELLQRIQQLCPVSPLDFTLCIPKERVRFERIIDGLRTAGTQPPHGSFITLVSDNPRMIQRFFDHFSPYGHIGTPDSVKIQRTS